MNDNVIFNNPIKAQIIRKNGDVIDIDMVMNGVVDQGFEYLLGSAFLADSQISQWYIGLINGEGASIPLLDPSDIMASHAWAENTGYDEADRPLWNPIVISSKSVANTTTTDFTFNTTAQIRGIFVPSDKTKNAPNGLLWSTALFNSNMDFMDDDVLRIIYTVSAS